MSAEGGNITHCVEGGVAKVHHQGFFLCNPDGESGEKKVGYWIGEHFLVEFNVAKHEHGRRHQVGCLREGREANDVDGGAGVVSVILETIDQLE